MPNTVFPALLRYWRRRRGLSQLDLSELAGVSARHISFLENARAQPTRSMVSRLANALGLSLREQNRLLEGAGLPPRFADPDADHIGPAALDAVRRLGDQLAPWPVVALDRTYDRVYSNGPASHLLSMFGYGPEVPVNLLDVLFDPAGARAHIVEWEPLARRLLARIQRTALLETADGDLPALIDRLLAYDGVPEDWREPDFAEDTRPLLPLRLQLPSGEQLSFLTTVTSFSDPGRRAVEELMIETYIPEDEPTTRFLRQRST